MKKSTIYLVISLLTFVIGYIFLKNAYLQTENLPFVQEIVLIVLGTIATIAITAALLNKQSEIELEKEQRVKIFDIKSDLYFELLDFLEKIVLKAHIDDSDLTKLEFLTHKISVLAGRDVLNEYYNLLSVIKSSSEDQQITDKESDIWSVQIANLCTKIRYDLVPENENTTTKDSLAIEKNNTIFLD